MDSRLSTACKSGCLHSTGVTQFELSIFLDTLCWLELLLLHLLALIWWGISKKELSSDETYLLKEDRLAHLGKPFQSCQYFTAILFDNQMKTRRKCVSFAPLLAMVITPGETVWNHLSCCPSCAERTVLKILSSDQDASLWLKRFSLERHSSCKKVKMCSWSPPWTFSLPPTFSILNKHWVHS